MHRFDLPRRLAAEALGTALLVATVVGSGIMAETLAKDVALALLGNTLPTGAILVVLITDLRPGLRRAFQSGGDARLCAAGANCRRATRCSMSPRRSPAASPARSLAHAMFELPLLDVSLKTRTGGANGSPKPSPPSGWCDDPRRHPLQPRRRCRGWSGSTSRRPTGSPPRRRSPIRPSRSRGR